MLGCVYTYRYYADFYKMIINFNYYDNNYYSWLSNIIIIEIIKYLGTFFRFAYKLILCSDIPTIPIDKYKFKKCLTSLFVCKYF